MIGMYSDSVAGPTDPTDPTEFRSPTLRRQKAPTTASFGIKRTIEHTSHACDRRVLVVVASKHGAYMMLCQFVFVVLVLGLVLVLLLLVVCSFVS